MESFSHSPSLPMGPLQVNHTYVTERHKSKGQRLAESHGTQNPSPNDTITVFPHVYFNGSEVACDPIVISLRNGFHWFTEVEKSLVKKFSEIVPAQDAGAYKYDYWVYDGSVEDSSSSPLLIDPKNYCPVPPNLSLIRLVPSLKVGPDTCPTLEIVSQSSRGAECITGVSYSMRGPMPTPSHQQFNPTANSYQSAYSRPPEPVTSNSAVYQDMDVSTSYQKHIAQLEHRIAELEKENNTLRQSAVSSEPEPVHMVANLHRRRTNAVVFPSTGGMLDVSIGPSEYYHELEQFFNSNQYRNKLKVHLQTKYKEFNSEELNRYRKEVQRLCVYWLLVEAKCLITPGNPNLQEKFRLAYSMVELFPCFKKEHLKPNWSYLAHPDGKNGYLLGAISNFRRGSGRKHDHINVTIAPKKSRFAEPSKKGVPVGVVNVPLDDSLLETLASLPDDKPAHPPPISKEQFDMLNTRLRSITVQRNEAPRTLAKISSWMYYTRPRRFDLIRDHGLDASAILNLWPKFQDCPSLLEEEFLYATLRRGERQEGESVVKYSDLLQKIVKALFEIALWTAYASEMRGASGEEENDMVLKKAKNASAIEKSLRIELLKFGIDHINVTRARSILTDDEQFIVALIGLMHLVCGNNTTQIPKMIDSFMTADSVSVGKSVIDSCVPLRIRCGCSKGPTKCICKSQPRLLCFNEHGTIFRGRSEGSDGVLKVTVRYDDLFMFLSGKPVKLEGNLSSVFLILYYTFYGLNAHYPHYLRNVYQVFDALFKVSLIKLKLSDGESYNASVLAAKDNILSKMEEIFGS